MIVKLLSTVFISYNIDIVHSFTSPTTLRMYYKGNAQKMKKLQVLFISQLYYMNRILLCKVIKKSWDPFAGFATFLIAPLTTNVEYEAYLSKVSRNG